MKTISDQIMAQLPGWRPTEFRAQLNIQIKFGLWRGYHAWLEPHLVDQLGWPSQVLDQYLVTTTVLLNNQTVQKVRFRQFETVTMTWDLDDAQVAKHHLEIQFQGLDQLPRRGSDDDFVCAMCQVQSIQLHDIELVSLLDNCMHGQDRSCGLQFDTPSWPWLVHQHQLLMPGVFALTDQYPYSHFTD